MNNLTSRMFQNVLAAGKKQSLTFNRGLRCSQVVHMQNASHRYYHSPPEHGFTPVGSVGAQTPLGLTSKALPKGFLNPAFLLPTPYKTAWTTDPTLRSVPGVLARYPLSDRDMGVTKNSGGTRKTVAATNAHDGTMAWEAFYPKGSINPDNRTAPKGGFGMYVSGPGGSEWPFDQAKSILVSYGVLFQPGFQFNHGGKLPGPYGGTTPDLAYGCSGGRQQGRDNCFSLRLMWRENGDGELYTYLPNTPGNTAALRAVPHSSSPDGYGFNVGQGSWRFTPGEWSVMAQKVTLNDIGVANGSIELWHNGKSVISVKGLTMRQPGKDVRFRGIHFQTFFGGKDAYWASPRDQKAWFADVTGAIVKRF